MVLDTNGDKAEVLNFETYPTAKKLVNRCQEFFAEVQNLSESLHAILLRHGEVLLTESRTPGKDLEHRLNTEYGPGNPFYEDFCRYIKQGLQEGWVAQTGQSHTLMSF